MAISQIPLLKHRYTVITPADQDEFVVKYEATNDHLSNTFVPEMNSAISTINSLSTQVSNDRVLAQAAKDSAREYAQEALDSVVSASGSASTATTKAQESLDSADSAFESKTIAEQAALEALGYVTTYADLSALDGDIKYFASLDDADMSALNKDTEYLGDIDLSAFYVDIALETDIQYLKDIDDANMSALEV